MTHIQAAVIDTVGSRAHATHRDGTPLGKRVLQFAVLVAATAPVVAGAWGVVDAPGESTTGLSSHARYLSGLLFAIGLGFWSTVPRIEHKSERFRLLTILVVIGGVCRLAGVTAGDALSLQTGAALVMELFITPLLCFWQGRTARTAALPP